MTKSSHAVVTLALAAALAASATIAAQPPVPPPAPVPRASIAQPPVPPPAPTPQVPDKPQPPLPPPPPPPAPARSNLPMTSLDLQVVISRYVGQKQISSLPYSLAVTANAVGEAQLNMGTDVPVPSTTFTPQRPSPPPPPPQPGQAAAPPAAAPPAPPPMLSYSYRSVGTVIGCRASGGENGRYEVTISVDDTSVFTSDQAAPPMPVQGTMPMFRSFRARNTLLLQDGQSRQYTAAADRVSGEVVRVEVTLRVVK